jgi:hypothetical protein
LIIEFYTSYLNCSAISESLPVALVAPSPQKSPRVANPIAPAAPTFTFSLGSSSFAKKHADAAAAGKGAAAQIEAASSSASEAGHRLFLFMSRRLHADATALQTALDAVTTASPVAGTGTGTGTVESKSVFSAALCTAQSASTLTRATALVRLRLGALLKTFDRAFAPRTDRSLPQINGAGAAMRLGTGSGAATLYCGRRLGRALIPGSDGQCGPNNGPQCADCAAAPKPVVAQSAPTIGFGAAASGAPAEAAAAAPATAAAAMWQCGACTLMNAADANACAACETARP